MKLSVFFHIRVNCLASRLVGIRRSHWRNYRHPSALWWNFWRL